MTAGSIRAPLALTDLPLVRVTASTTPVALTNPADFDLAGRVVDHVRAQAAARPDRPAIVHAGSVISYGELTEQIAELGAALRAGGCGSGDIVACLGHRTARTPVIFLALESLGAVYLPLDPGWPAARISEVLRSSGSAFLIDYSAPEPQAPEIRSLPRTSEPRCSPLVLDGSEPRYVIYTSGTTGRPKGAVVAQAGLLNHLWAKITDLEFTAEDRVAFTAPLVFDISIWQMLAPLMVGAALVITTESDTFFPPRLHRLLVRHQVTVVELVPTAIGTLLDEALRRPADRALASLRWLISTGEELKPKLAEYALKALPHVHLLNAYGPTECSDDITHHVVSAEDVTGSRLPVGRPIGNAKIYCLAFSPEEQAWSAAAPGEVGEIFVGGIAVGLGYLDAPEATGEAFFRDTLDPDSPTGRIYRTGDLGRIDGDTVHYFGRVDRQVKVAGVRLELDEIEAVLSRHPAVRSCAVTLSEEAARRQFLCAHYVLAFPVDAEELAGFLRETLPASSVPRHWDELDALPLTPNGKVDHRVLTKKARNEGAE